METRALTLPVSFVEESPEPGGHAMFQFLFGVAFGAAGYWAWQSFGRDLLGMGSDQDTTYGGFSSGGSSNTSFGSATSGTGSAYGSGSSTPGSATPGSSTAPSATGSSTSAP